MKIKNILLPVLALGALASVSFGATKTVLAKAEEEPAVEVAEPQQSEVDWEKMYEDAIAKYNEIRNTQVLGTTVGGIAAALVSILITVFFNKVSSARIDKLSEVSRNADGKIKSTGEILDMASANYAKAIAIGEEMNNNCLALIKEAKDEITTLKEQGEAMIEQRKMDVEKQLEERQFFLTIISNSPEMVANGTAEKLNAMFEKVNKEEVEKWLRNNFTK